MSEDSRVEIPIGGLIRLPNGNFARCTQVPSYPPLCDNCCFYTDTMGDYCSLLACNSDERTDGLGCAFVELVEKEGGEA